MTPKLVRLAAVLAAVSWMAGHAALAAPSWPIPDGVKTVEVDGYPLAYAEAGQGVPLVIIHGAWVDQRLFNATLTEFAKTNRVINISLRHHWPEPWDGQGGRYSVEQHARDTAALIRALGLPKVHLLGHSRGGGVAVAVARQAPDLIRTLILVEPFGLAEVSTDPAAMRQRMDGAAGLAAGLRQALQSGKTREEVAERGWEMANGPGSWARMPPPIRQMVVDNIATMAAAPVASPPPLATCDDVGRFTFPVLLLQSASAARLYVDTHEGLRRCNAAIAPAVVVPESGHNIQLSNPAGFNRVVLDFVSGR